VSGVRAKTFAYAIGLDREGRVTAGGTAPQEIPASWTPEDLVLAGLARCSLKSLAFHVRRAGAELVASATATGHVTKREEDGRYAFVDVQVDADVQLDPEPAEEDVVALLQKAERDCFVGASLTVKTAYRWTVNGREIAPEG
jgi:organic hydroperoxide reductase OsmC/OhrA